MSSVLEVNLKSIKDNIKKYRLEIGDKKKFCAVVKADCYGLGAKQICKEIDFLVDYFAVSSEREFLEIERVVTKPILILDPIYKNITKLAKRNCEFCVSNFAQFEKVLKLSKRNKNTKYKIHIKVNTGMNRFGFSCVDEIVKIFNYLQKRKIS